MSHPILVAARAADRRRWCPRGTIAQQPCSLCRECQVAAAWRREIVRTSRRAGPNWTRTETTRARLFTWMMPLLQIFSEGAEN